MKYYNIIGKQYYFLVISAILTVVAIVSFAMWGLNLGIDFTGGTLMQLKFSGTRPDNTTLETKLNEITDLGDVQLQTVNENSVIFKLKFISNEQRKLIMDKFPEAQEESFETIGPSMGNEMAQKSLWAIILVSLSTIAYVSWSFRKVSTGPVPSWVYGVSAIIAMIHDLFIMLGVFIILGHFLNIELNSMFVTAALTVLGYSINDTIVVFDRIREKLKTSASDTFKGVINESINQTMARSLNTTLTTLFTLFALYLFGGDTIRYFVLALIVGIITGAYSSIFIASPFLLFFQKILKK